MRRAFVFLLSTGLLLVTAVPAEATPVPGAPACPTTPADSFWHADVSSLPVHSQSSTFVASIGSTAGLKADFGAGLWDGAPIGIPFTTVPGTQARVPVAFDYADESDPGPYPIPANAPVEGGGDRHVLVVDRDRCELWETWNSVKQADGSWTAGSGARFSLTSNAMRPAGWTSADAAGLPVLPGLVRYDEVAAGLIDHAIRFTAPRTAPAYVWPASHKAGAGTSSDPPMGTWVRLKASFDISGFSATNQVILRALKKHGMVLADNGSSWYMSGVPDERWNNDDLRLLGAIKGTSFEVVNGAGLKVADGSYQAAGTTTPPPTTTTTTSPPPTTTTTTSPPPTTTTTVKPTTTTSTTQPPTTTTTVKPTTTTTSPPPTTTTTTPTSSPNLIGNPGFEANTRGWDALGGSLARVSGGHSGAWRGRLTRASGTGDVSIDDGPNWVRSTQARAYVARVWIKGPAGRTASLRVREMSGSSVVRESTVLASLTGAWQEVTLTTAAAGAGRALDLRVTGRSFAGAEQLQVDDFSLR